MKSRETIAIIGATGTVGAAIAGRLSQANYSLILMSKDTEKLEALVESLQVTDANAFIDSGNCPKEVSWQADIIIVAAPDEASNAVAEKIRDVATGKVVISVSDQLNTVRTHAGRVPDASAAEELQRLLPYSKVVKAFNAVFTGSPFTTGVKSDVFIAANSGNALEVASKLLTSAGFNPVVVGDLSVSRTLERMRLSKLTFIPTFGRPTSN